MHVRCPESLLDQLLPRFNVRQVHDVWVPAPADVVYSAGLGDGRECLPRLQHRKQFVPREAVQ